MQIGPNKKPGEPFGNRPASGARPRQPPRGPAAAGPRRPPPPFVQRYRGLLLGASTVVLLAALALIFVLKSGSNNQTKEQASSPGAVDPAVVAALSQIPAAISEAIGTGTAANPPKAISGTPLQQNGKPEVLYVGAEYCPFCAAERWAVVAALSRFGSVSNLQTTRSAAGDVFPNTASVTFYGATYSSDYLSFSGVEQYTNQRSGSSYAPLQSLTGEQQSVVSTYNRPPYTASAGGIPFVDFGGKFVLSGATYDPSVLAGMNWRQIANALKTAGTPQAQGIIGSANLLTAVLCQLTGQQPGNVCQAAAVQKAANLLGKG